MEPNHLPGSVDDLGARRVAASRRGDEDVPVCLVGVAGQHGERRGRGAGSPDGARGGGAAPAGGQGEDETDDSGDTEQQPPAPRAAQRCSHTQGLPPLRWHQFLQTSLMLLPLCEHRATDWGRPPRSGGAGTSQGPGERRIPGPTSVLWRRAQRR